MKIHRIIFNAKKTIKIKYIEYIQLRHAWHIYIKYNIGNIINIGGMQYDLRQYNPCTTNIWHQSLMFCMLAIFYGNIIFRSMCTNEKSIFLKPNHKIYIYTQYKHNNRFSQDAGQTYMLNMPHTMLQTKQMHENVQG